MYFETLKNIADEAKRDLMKTFTSPNDGMLVHNIVNIDDWVNKADDNKQQLDQITQQKYNEFTSKMIRTNNADLLSQMITNNEIRDSLILKKNYRSKRT